MDSFDTARAMVEHYMRLGAAKIEQERQWRKVAGQIETGRGLGVIASRPLDGISKKGGNR